MSGFKLGMPHEQTWFTWWSIYWFTGSPCNFRLQAFIAHRNLSQWICCNICVSAPDNCSMHWLSFARTWFDSSGMPCLAWKICTGETRPHIDIDVESNVFGSPSWLGCRMHSGWMNAVGCAMHVALSRFGMFWVRVWLRPCLTSCWSNSSGTMLLWIQTLQMLRKQHILNNPLWWHWSRFNSNLPQPYHWINCWSHAPRTVLSCPWSPMLGQFDQGIHLSPPATAGSASSSEPSSLPGAGCWHLWCALASVCPHGSC